MAIDQNGNTYCGGYTNGAMGEVNAGITDLFIIKLNSSGSLVWLTQLGTTTKTDEVNANTTCDTCYDVIIDQLGNVYCGGDTEIMSEQHVGGYDPFVVKLDNNGNLIWASQLGASTKKPGLTNANSDFEVCYGIAADTQGNIFCTGESWGPFGENNGGGGSSDLFILKFDRLGNVFY